MIERIGFELASCLDRFANSDFRQSLIYAKRLVLDRLICESEVEQ
jgi:hypothetical protein